MCYIIFPCKKDKRKKKEEDVYNDIENYKSNRL